MRFPTLISVLALAGCQGVIAGPHRDDPGTEERGGLPSVEECEGQTPTAGPRPFMRLTGQQYRNTLRDLLGVDAEVARSFVEDERVAGFEVAHSVSPLQVEKYANAARELAARVDVSRLRSCDDGEACARESTAALGRRAFRRPLTDEERTDLLELWRVGTEGGTFDDGLRLVVEGVLTSPDFLYHVEVGGEPGETVELDDIALASRLSYLLWDSMPDEALLAEAEAGTLDLATEARRMMNDSRYVDAVQEFYRQWLGLDRLEGLSKDSAVYPEFTPDLATDLRASLEAYIDHVHFGPDPRLENLFTARAFFVNERLAEVYGVEPAGSDLAPADARPGLLSHPGLLALLAKPDQSDPIHRGLFVRRQLLCHELPAPPNDADLNVDDPEPGASTRDRFAQHTASETCASCHRLIDPIGFAFEHYDGMGRFRTVDEGVPVDARGSILNGGDATSTFDGVDELTRVLGTSDRVLQCYAEQWFRFALRRATHGEDACSLAQITEQFEASEGDLTELVVSIVTSDAFRHRHFADGEESGR